MLRIQSNLPKHYYRRFNLQTFLHTLGIHIILKPFLIFYILNNITKATQSISTAIKQRHIRNIF